ncbi:hypothetical protein ACFOMD_15615 [Sphingoaurantiacus capsulatus]|uniref:Uncharacterized protein n=1 Tax=Sphingoaurantiacus capsulatus TaxID=1771310 RepID=A0ABV7XH13_9SPHN
MRFYERLFPIAMLTCVGAGAWAFVQADAVSASHDFLAAALAMRLDERLRGRWWVIEDDAAEWAFIRGVG